MTAANVSSTADATAEASPTIPAQNMAAVESDGASSDSGCTPSDDQAAATATGASGSDSGMGNVYAASASAAPSSSGGEAANATGTGAASSTATAAAAAASNGTSSGATGDQAKYLDLHNQLRAKHSGSGSPVISAARALGWIADFVRYIPSPLLSGANPVTWDSTLADYANTHASKCVFEHS